MNIVIVICLYFAVIFLIGCVLSGNTYAKEMERKNRLQAREEMEQPAEPDGTYGKRKTEMA